MSNPVVHFEILGADGGGLVQFYRELFGWQIHDGQLPGWPVYGLVLAGESGIGGAVGTADAATEPTVVVYVEVDDPHAYLERATTLGATVVLPVTNIEEAKVTVGWLRDPQGNVVGVVKNNDTAQ